MRKLLISLTIVLGMSAMNVKAQSVSYAKSLIQQERYLDAAKQLRPLADDGDAEAQYLAAWLFFKGKGVSKNEAQSIKYATMAANQGSKNVSTYAQRFLLIDKQHLRLYVIERKRELCDTIFSTPIGCGKNLGKKTKKGDNKTPEGVFTISQISNSSKWTHDFKDGRGQRKGAYGPYFFRLKVPGNNSIGIHGTCFPESIGTRCSEGCIRVENKNLVRLRSYIKVGMKCKILSDF